MSSFHVLTIGTNYKGTTSELAGCENDARDWAKLCKPKADSVTTLLGNRVTWDNILKQGRKLLDRLESGDTAWITFSGHGTREPDRSGDERTGFDQALVLADFELIFDDEMAELLRDRAKGSFVFAFLDCCHSGTMHRGAGKPRTIPFARCRRRKREAFPHTLRSLTNVAFFSGCQDGPSDYSYDAYFGRRGNGAATHYGIQAIRELKRGASYARWFNRLGGRQGYLPNEDYPQTPQMHGSARNLTRAVPVL